LKTSDKTEACRRADSHTRRLDALWKAYRERHETEGNAQLALATLEAASLKLGHAKLQPDDPTIDNFLSYYLPSHEPYEPRPTLTAQEQLTVDILYGEKIPRTLSDAKDLHFELGKGPKNRVGEQQFDRAWNLLLEITGDITLDNLNREHAREFVRRLVADLPRVFHPATIGAELVFALPTFFGPPEARFFQLLHDDGLVAPSGKCSALGTLYPMALWGRSSL